MNFNPLSSMFIFSYLYFLTYFLSPFILMFDPNMIVMHVSRPVDLSLILSILFSIFVYIIVLVGYKTEAKKYSFLDYDINISDTKLLLFTIISLYFFLDTFSVYILDRFDNGTSINIFNFSNGNGMTILLSTMYQYAFIFMIINIYSKKVNNICMSKQDILLLIIFILLLNISSIVLSTRRDIATLFLGIILLLNAVCSNGLLKILLFFSVVCIPIASAILQVFRAFFLNNSLQNQSFEIKLPDQSLIQFADSVSYWGYFLKQILVSTFEGHWLAIYLSKINLKEFLFGVNQFEILGNMLSYVPRAIWSSKPYDLGNLEIQKFLASESFNGELPIVTLPPTFITEALYCFGIFGCFFIAYFLGKILKIIDSVFVNYKNNIILIFIVFYTYINMFNLIRSGSAYFFNILIPIILLNILIRFKDLLKIKSLLIKIFKI